MYEEFPLCIQRKVAKRAWGKDWPIYALLGLPNMSKDLEKKVYLMMDYMYGMKNITSLYFLLYPNECFY